MHGRRFFRPWGTMLFRQFTFGLIAAIAAMLGGYTIGAPAAAFETQEPPMLSGLNGWTVQPIITIGESVDGYWPVGKPDGMGAYRWSNQAGDERVRVLLNHELNPGTGFAYTLANGTRLTGARISYLDFDPVSRALVASGIAYDKVHDAAGRPVTAAAQINETNHRSDGLGRLCSARYVAAGTFGLANDIFFTNEEMGARRRAKGGLVWALDIKTKSLWAVPAMGRAAWENVTPIAPPTPETVAFLLGDDTSAAPLWLYVGKKDPDGGFLARNGLAEGYMFAWRAYDVGRSSPDDWNGTTGPETLGGCFIRNPVAGLSSTEMREAARARHAFAFARPEDVHANPHNPNEAVFATTGDGSAFPADDWGTLYRVRPDFERGCGSGGSGVHADVTILYDGDAYDDPDQDGAPNPDFGLRNPDNLVWSGDGFIYVQEDASTDLADFGGASGREASIWRVDPESGALLRIAEVDRAPFAAHDDQAGEIGAWETSGVIDVTALFATGPSERLLMSTVQAHSLKGGFIEQEDLDEGGQVVFLSYTD